MPDIQKKHLEIPLTGKLMTGEPATIGTNFQTLKNLRYTNSAIQGVHGNTKINTPVLDTYLKTRSAFHFKKSQPMESHLLAQSYNTGLTVSQIIDNTVAIPSAGHFNELMTLDVAATAANFAVGSTIHGNTSGTTCVIVKMLTTLTYIVKGRSGAFTLGEVLHDGTNSADQGAANPTFALSALFTDSSGAGVGSFCNAPDGQIVYANGVDTCIWGGDEITVEGFITSSATVGADGAATNPKDFTTQLKNSKTDGDNIAHIGGGNDSYVKLLIHANEVDGTAGTSIIDSETSAKTITAVGNAQVDTAQAKFGTGSVLFDGTGDYLTTPDHADWYFAADPFTIDTWVRFGSASISQGICSQYGDVDNYWGFGYKVSSNGLFFTVKVAGTFTASYFKGWTPVINTWYHLELARNGTDVYLFINGVSQTFTASTAISTNEVPNLAAVLEIAGYYNHSTVLNGWLDEFRISKGIARHTSDFTPPAMPYRSSQLTFLVGSPRPLQGIKPYILSGNTTTSTLTGSVWNGHSWDTLTLTDNTDTGASLAVTGAITFPSTVLSAKPKYLEGYYLYWYQFALDAGECDIYKITLDAPFQPLIDLWDGQYRDIAAVYIRTTSLKDVSLNVLRDDYDVDTPDTYANLSGLLWFSFQTSP
jgi:hypothetical protein